MLTEALRLPFAEQDEKLGVAGSLPYLPLTLTYKNSSLGSFAPVPLAFAWTRSNDVPLILGHVNFFLEFEVCFFRARKFFEVRPRIEVGL
jgi:hypothetical protein